MRTTTELTVHFVLAANIDARDYAEDLWERHEGEFSREEEIATERCDAYDLYQDALDFETVPFEHVEAALSVELYDQDEADMREHGAWRHRCMCCGAEPWTDEGLALVGARFYCTKCYQEALKLRIFTEEQVRRKNKQRWKHIKTQRGRRLAALKEAMRIAPHMNWEPYKREFGPLELAD